MPFHPFLGEGSPTKTDYRKKGTLIPTFLLEDLVNMGVFPSKSDDSPLKPGTPRLSNRVSTFHYMGLSFVEGTCFFGGFKGTPIGNHDWKDMPILDFPLSPTMATSREKDTAAYNATIRERDTVTLDTRDSIFSTG